MIKNGIQILIAVKSTMLPFFDAFGEVVQGSREVLEAFTAELHMGLNFDDTKKHRNLKSKRRPQAFKIVSEENFLCSLNLSIFAIALERPCGNSLSRNRIVCSGLKSLIAAK